MSVQDVAGACGLDVAMLRLIEAGSRMYLGVGDRVLLERGLGWLLGSVERVLDGADPTVVAAEGFSGVEDSQQAHAAVVRAWTIAYVEALQKNALSLHSRVPLGMSQRSALLDAACDLEVVIDGLTQAVSEDRFELPPADAERIVSAVDLCAAVSEDFGGGDPRVLFDRAGSARARVLGSRPQVDPVRRLRSVDGREDD
ncbi:hypothetical protein [Gordonia sihwensis]|uniref:hypothetical protein n=1 Tax=Gordonia sihwensis TaxID=173559 RepID=UPI003D99BBBF